MNEREASEQAAEINNSLRLTKDQLFKKAQQDFLPLIELGKITVVELQAFITEKVTGIKVNGIDLISIDFDHRDEKIHPIAEAYIRSANTKLFLAEYFYPEIETANENTALFPLLKMFGSDYTDRLNYAKKLAAICADAQKSVAVADIANKSRYLLFREFFRNFPIALTQVLLRMEVLVPLVRAVDTPVTMTTLLWTALMIISFEHGKFIFNKNEIQKYEKFVLDFEQARRFFVAHGLLQLAEEYGTDGDQKRTSSQIVAMNPVAHTMRIEESIVDRAPRSSDKVKSFIYKLFGPTLDFSVRQWKWTASNNGGSWMRYSNRKIEV